MNTNHIQNSKSKVVQASEASLRTRNPIREVVDQLDIRDIHPDKPLISLSIGDPTVGSGLSTSSVATDAIVKATQSLQANGYPPAVGSLPGRAAVAELYHTPQAPISPNDVILTSGCSHALLLAFQVLLSPARTSLCPSQASLLPDHCRAHWLRAAGVRPLCGRPVGS